MHELGLLMLLTASALIGNQYAKSLEMRVKRLVILEKCCTEIETELRFLLPTIPRLLQILASRTTFSSLRFLKTAAEHAEQYPNCWRDALAADKQISSEERAILYALGDVLGTTDLEGQLAVLEQGKARFATIRTDLEQDLHMRTRLVRSLGVFGGLFLVLILI